MDIPYERLETTTLNRLIEDFITREGTDYGDREYDLKEKVAQVLRQLKNGEAKITFDPDDESCSIVSTKI